MRKFVSLFLFTFMISPNAFGAWYILLPKKSLPEHRQMSRNVPIPKLKGTKIKPKPYSVEVQKVLAPSFSVPTKRGKLTKRNLEGKNVVIFFVNSFFSPFTEKLVSQLERQEEKKTVFIVVSVNDADFSSIDTFKKLMGIRKTIVTADSYLFYQFKNRLKKLKIPSVVVIDKFGFIRFFSPEINRTSVARISKELSGILTSLKG